MSREPRERRERGRERTERGRGRARREQSYEPIWNRPEPSGRRAPRSRDDIAAAAIDVADAEGIEAVSMRRVAAELGLGTMSLYHYLRGKDELLDLMSDGIMAGQVLDDEELRHGWRAGLTAIARATHANLQRHPWMGSALRTRAGTTPGPNAIRHVEQSLAAVADTGADIKTRMEIIALVDDYVIGHTIRAQAVAQASAEGLEADPLLVQRIFDYFERELATGRYPHLKREIDAHRAAGGSFEDFTDMLSTEDRFEHGLQRVLDGIGAGLKKRRGR
jgi:AcrR family transcriptional regulator